MNKKQALETVFNGDASWDEYQEREVAHDIALEYLLDGRL